MVVAAHRLAFGLSFLCACGGSRAAPAATSPAVTCDGVGAHVKQLMMESPEMRSAPPDEQKEAAALIVIPVTDVVRDCQDQQWSEDKMKCHMAAGAIGDMEKCHTKK